VASDVNAFVINLIFFMQVLRMASTKSRSRILLIADGLLPARPQALGIADDARSRQPWGETKIASANTFEILAGIVLHGAAVAVETKDHRSGAGAFLERRLDDGLAFDAIDGPVVGL